MSAMQHRDLHLDLDDATLDGELWLPPEDAPGVVLFAHGRGSSPPTPST